MPVEEGTKRKNTLFPFKILRKRSSKGKGKSKSLVDLYNPRDGQSDGKINSDSKGRKRLSQNVALSSSFEANAGNVDQSFDEKDSIKGEDELLFNNSCTMENDRVDGYQGTENADGRDPDAEEEDITPESEGLAVGKDEEAEQFAFPAGTTVALAWKSNMCSLFQMDIEIKEGVGLIARDRSGTSDPYVKAKFRGKCVYKTKVVMKDLNPVWNEKFSMLFDDVNANLSFKVYDFDRLSSDDQMGVATLNIADLELQRMHCLELDLINLTGLQEDLGKIVLTVRVTPKAAAAGGLTRRVSSRNVLKRSNRSQLWDGLVTITLVEGKKLNSCDDNGLSDPYCKFKIGNEKHRSKFCKATLNPQWREKFELKIYHDSIPMLEVQVWDRDTGRDEFMGRGSIDLNEYEREKTHFKELQLEDCAGAICFYFTITGSGLSESESSPAKRASNRQEIQDMFLLRRTWKNPDLIGWLKIQLHKAVGLASADIGGASDPFAIIELNNQRVITQTIYKTLNPQWERFYEMPVFDIHDVINITIFDEDRRGAPEFLGRVGIPLLSIFPEEKRLYQLKDKSLERQAKGHVVVTFDLIYNPIRASIRTFNPKEVNVLSQQPRFRRQLLQQNVDRLSNVIRSIIATGQFIQSLFTWKYKLRSAFAFVLYVLLVLNFDLFFIPLILLLILLKNYIVFMLSPERDDSVDLDKDSTSTYDEDDDEDDEMDSKSKKGKGKTLREKLEAVTNICTTVQNQLDGIASFAERIKNTFNWSVPFCSYLLMFILTIGTILLYLLPLRYILLVWGINKFTKKIRKPNAVGNNELLDFLSRVPSDPELKQRRRLKTDMAIR